MLRDSERYRMKTLTLLCFALFLGALASVPAQAQSTPYDKLCCCYNCGWQNGSWVCTQSHCGVCPGCGGPVRANPGEAVFNLDMRDPIQRSVALALEHRRIIDEQAERKTEHIEGIPMPVSYRACLQKDKSVKVSRQERKEGVPVP